MDIWEKLYDAARKEYHPTEVTPFVYAHHVVCALEERQNFHGILHRKRERRDESVRGARRGAEYVRQFG